MEEVKKDRAYWEGELAKLRDQKYELIDKMCKDHFGTIDKEKREFFEAQADQLIRDYRRWINDKFPETV